MTPKEKADDLINQMEQIIQPWESNECALIAVNEIIHSYEKSYRKGWIDFIKSPNPVEYWREVKMEIQKTLE